MAPAVDTSPGPRLARLARRAERARDDAAAPCELCGAPLGADHRHVLDLERRELQCVCRACALLFEGAAAAEGRRRAVGDRRLALPGYVLGDALWEELRLPVDVAFLVRDTPSGRVCAFYPSPAGATESLLTLDAWRQL